MVLFSMHARARVPASVASWFREWFRRQGDEQRALALLLDGQAKDTPGVDELSAAARLRVWTCFYRPRSRKQSGNLLSKKFIAVRKRRLCCWTKFCTRLGFSSVKGASMSDVG